MQIEFIRAELVAEILFSATTYCGRKSKYGFPYAFYYLVRYPQFNTHLYDLASQLEEKLQSLSCHQVPHASYWKYQWLQSLAIFWGLYLGIFS